MLPFKYQEVLRSYNHAIELNPNAANYENRGIVKSCKINDIYGGLNDFNQAILIESKNADVYVSRGLLKNEILGDHLGGIEDLQQAARLYKQQGDSKNYQMVIDLIEDL